MSESKEISLSVEETNKLRLKLGLKPLRFDDKEAAESKQSQDGERDSDDASSSADSHAHLTQTELDQRRRQAARQLAERTEERRRKAIHSALTAGPTLGEEADDDLDDPAAWVARMRKNEKEKHVLASQARVDAAHYDDSDDESAPAASAREFQTEDASMHRGKRRRERRGSISSSEGEAGEGGDVKVVHDLKEFEEGETVVLTLKDTQILTADGALNDDIDTLENVALVEKNKQRKKLRDKERKAVYDPTEDWEEGEDGQPKKKEILEHYDEWEREERAAQGKGRLPEDDRGFLLPNLQGRDLDEPVEVQIELLRERQRLVEREKQKLLGLSSLSAYHRDGVALTGPTLGRQKYDASGLCSVVISGEREATKRGDGGDAGEAVAFRKLKKKKIQKKKQGAEFWKELLGGKPQEEEEGEEKETPLEDDDGIKPAAVKKTRRNDRHHGSRAEKRESESKTPNTQKQHVREALEAAKVSAKHVSPQPPSSSSRKGREGQDEGKELSRGKECRSPSRQEGEERSNMEEDREKGMDEDLEDNELDDLSAADRELQESLEKQRRLAVLKLREQREETDETQSKTPQVRLLKLLRSQARHKGNIVDAELLPNDGSGSPKDKGSAADAPEAQAEEEEDEALGLQLSTTTEFCRAIQTPLEKLLSMKQEPYGNSRQSRQDKPAHAQPDKREKRSNSNEKEKEEGEADDSDNDGRGDERRSREKDEDSSEEEEDLDTGFMNENPMGHGLAEALKYLQSKNHYSLDKMRQRRHRPDELPLHKPLGEKDIKIDHRDQYGNVMTPKDAFREISWRFHGKYPSLRKQEKKMKKMDIERKLLQNPMEALPTLSALQRLQEKEKASHLVLTGGSMDQ
ncbi:SART-1 family protein [Toxoplasma gondii CAST]|uniref:SART-1 family protein n=1 Tax=Toxoplasma gondii CAST TaxID=943122 RepID=A0A3R8G1W9_TOXGO|nr:SART-1 family protein [Toxoplasma gondii CAST]